MILKLAQCARSDDIAHIVAKVVTAASELSCRLRFEIPMIIDFIGHLWANRDRIACSSQTLIRFKFMFVDDEPLQRGVFQTLIADKQHSRNDVFLGEIFQAGLHSYRRQPGIGALILIEENTVHARLFIRRLIGQSRSIKKSRT
ncbi:hypothetical protein SDC9_187646 [bioreactor metagenome]|uniref:Uncharacterized protein n=1 Tax=bioreactor metagenome TaxID=1076179 RepID=A0A645HM45_9ZZZZ